LVKGFIQFIIKNPYLFWVSSQAPDVNIFLIVGIDFSKKNLTIKSIPGVKKSANPILVSLSGFYDTIFHTMLIFGGLNFLVIKILS